LKVLALKAKQQNTILDWSTAPKLDALAEAQRRDKKLVHIIDHLVAEAKEGKSTEPLFMKTPKTAGWYFLDDTGLLRMTRDWKMVKDGNETAQPVVVPTAMRDRILWLFHASPWMAHLGWKKGLTLMRPKFFWYGMTADIQRYVNKCLLCGRSKLARPWRHGLSRVWLRSGPFETLHVDFCGPFSHRTDEHQYVFTAIDAFTRWVHFIPTYNQTAQTAAEALLHKVITIHGCPVKLVSDQGPHFIAGVWNSLSTRLGIKVSLTTPRHPQANGVAERVHRVLNAAIRASRKDDEPWVDVLPFIEWAHRTTPIEHLDLSPYEMLFGRDPRMPVDLQFAPSPGPSNEITEADRTSWLSHNLQRLSLIRKIVTDLSAQFKYKAAMKRDVKRKDVDWKAGDLVLVYMPTERKGIPKKRIMQWSSLAKIVKKTALNSYMVQREGKKNTEVFNVDRLFRMPPGTTTLSLKPDVEDELLGVFEIPEDAQARQTAWEKKRENRDKARRDAKNAHPDAKTVLESKDEISGEALLKERAEEIKSTMKDPAQAKVNDLALYRANRSSRWVLGNVMAVTGSGRRRKAVLQLYWRKKNSADPKVNITMDWAPLWNNRIKSSKQTANWKKPRGYVPYTMTVPLLKLKLVGLKLQKYTYGRRKIMKHRIDPAWWEVIESDPAIFEKFGPA